MLLEKHIQITPGVARVGFEFLDLHHPVHLFHEIKSVIQEYIILLIVLKETGQSSLKQGNLRVRIFHLTQHRLELRSLEAKDLIKANRLIGDLMHTQMKEVVQSFWRELNANGSSLCVC